MAAMAPRPDERRELLTNSLSPDEDAELVRPVPFERSPSHPASAVTLFSTPSARACAPQQGYSFDPPHTHPVATDWGLRRGISPSNPRKRSLAFH